jgi:hypothetical protein
VGRWVSAAAVEVAHASERWGRGHAGRHPPSVWGLALCAADGGKTSRGRGAG